MIFSEMKQEIKIALVGHVSVGKTTLLNAFLGDKYSEVSMRRTTAGVNMFRIMQPQLDDGGGAMNNDTKWDLVEERNEIQTSDATLQAITQDNQELRQQGVVVERVYNVEVREPIMEMHKSATLVMVDIPGINEAGSNTKYQDYLCRNWHTYDCVLLVMDASDGVLGEDKMELLRLISNSMTTVKELPLLVLANKCDGLFNEEGREMLDELQAAIQEVFGKAQCDDVEELLIKLRVKEKRKADKKKTLHEAANASVYFMPLSAKKAYIYRTAANMSLEKFNSFDKSLVESLGRELLGSLQWMKLPIDKRYSELHELLTDNDIKVQGLEESKFDSLLKALQFLMGGPETQKRLLVNQVEFDLSRMSPDSDIGDACVNAYKRLKMIDGDTDNIVNLFWSNFENCKNNAFRNTKSPLDMKDLAKPMNQLITFAVLSKEAGWESDTKIYDSAKKIVSDQLKMLLGNYKHWKNNKETDGLTRYDWVFVIRTVLSVLQTQMKSTEFLKELIMLEEANISVRCSYKDTFSGRFNECPVCRGELSDQCQCLNCKNHFVDSNKANCPVCEHKHNSTVSFPQYSSNLKIHCRECRTDFYRYSIETVGATLFEHLKLTDGKLTSVHKCDFTVDINASPDDPSHCGYLICLFFQNLHVLKA